jgi:DNA invertase Pin-like site-specific DNA recombinase
LPFAGEQPLRLQAFFIPHLKGVIGAEGMMIKARQRVAIYLRVSTTEQTTANQERELRAVASRMGCEVVKLYRDHGLSGAKGRHERPQFNRLCRDATKREFDAIMAWSVDHLGLCRTS